MVNLFGVFILSGSNTPKFASAWSGMQAITVRASGRIF